MISRVHGSILNGIDAINCEIEVDVSSGSDRESKIIGLAETVVKESINRSESNVAHGA